MIGSEVIIIITENDLVSAGRILYFLGTVQRDSETHL